MRVVLDPHPIRTWRWRNGVSQVELAAGIGVTSRSVKGWERGRRVGAKSAARLALFMGRSVEDLMAELALWRLQVDGVPGEGEP